MHIVQLCGSFGEQCGIARYSEYVSSALTSAGISNQIVRTIVQLEACLETISPDDALDVTVLVQHEYGIYDFASHLAGGDTTAGIISSLNVLCAKNRISSAAFVMHSLVTSDHVLNFANKQILSSSFPVYHLNRLGSQIAGIEFLEHGVIIVPGSNVDQLISGKLAVREFAQQQVASRSVGSFGLLSPNKQPRRILELAKRHDLKLVANFAARNKADALKLQQLVSSAQISSDIGYDFISESELLEKLNQISFAVSFQDDFKHFATTGSARFLLNFAVPLVLNTTTPFMDLNDVAIYDDGYGGGIYPYLDNLDIYASKITSVVNFSSKNSIVRVYQEMLDDLPRHFRDSRGVLNRHVYHYENLLSAPAVTTAVLYHNPVDEPSFISELADQSCFVFCAAPPELIKDNYVDSSKSIGWIASSDEPTEQTWQHRGFSQLDAFSQCVSEGCRWKPAIRLESLRVIPTQMQLSYLREVMVVDADTALRLECLSEDLSEDERLSAIAEILHGSIESSRVLDVHFLYDALKRRTFFSSEIDSLPILERAFATALIVDRKVPDESRLNLFKTLYNAGVLVSDLISSSEFSNALIRIVDEGNSTKIMRHNFGERRSMNIHPSFWQNYITQRYAIAPLIQASFDDGSSDSTQKVAAEQIPPSELLAALRSQRFRFPIAAVEDFAGLAHDRPWLEVALFSLTLRGATLIASCSEFSTKWTKAIHVSGEDQLPIFDYFILHKDHFRRARAALSSYREPLSIAFANEVLLVVSPARLASVPYSGAHAGGFDFDFPQGSRQVRVSEIEVSSSHQ